jgi:hypothetical protein
MEAAAKMWIRLWKKCILLASILTLGAVLVLAIPPSTGDHPMGLDTPYFWQRVEETLLVGRLEDFPDLLASLAAIEGVPEDLRYGVESLYQFRKHYADPSLGLSDDDARRVAKMDADWTMHLMDSIHTYAQSAQAKTA